MPHKALTPQSGRVSVPLTPPFNEAASDVSEIELKMLVPQKPDGSVDRAVFSSIQSYFQDKGWIRASSEIMRVDADGKVVGERGALLTRQLDTRNMDLYKKGVTLRMRGDCTDGNIMNVTAADICVKFGTTSDACGALRRQEFEARTADFGEIKLEVLLEKYPASEYPELHDALEGIKAEQLFEFHRPDVLRNRYLLEIPEDVTGLKGKTFFVELLLDEVSFVFDPKPQSGPRRNRNALLQGPIVYHVDLEIEMEAMFKPCAYDKNPESKNFVSSPMTRDELDIAMSALQKHLQTAAGGILTLNSLSKAERGFSHFLETVEKLKDYVELDTSMPHRGRVQNAFTIKAKPANDPAVRKLHDLLPHDFSGYVKDRRERGYPVARNP